MTELDPNSLERIVPREIRTEGSTAVETLNLHIERYQFARKHLVPGSLLDMACGVGYGTAILAEGNASISRAVGVDISEAAVDYGRQYYQDDNITFQCADALKYSPGETYNNIVSHETVEHVEDPRK